MIGSVAGEWIAPARTRTTMSHARKESMEWRRRDPALRRRGFARNNIYKISFIFSLERKVESLFHATSIGVPDEVEIVAPLDR